jgi:hypothetical protein
MAYPITRLRARALACCFAVAAAVPGTPWAAAPPETYNLDYHATLRPEGGIAHVTVALSGAVLPSRLVFTIDPERHLAFTADGKLTTERNTVTWHPPEGSGSLSYDFRVNNAIRSGSYDSYMNGDWAVFRGDRMVPPVRSLANRRLRAETTLRFDLPSGWSVLTPYPERGTHQFVIDNPTRRFDRPTGWFLAGRIGSRHETIAGISTVVGAPTGDDARRQDTLAFLNWNLPHVKALFPGLADRLLVVRAGDPMFRGGLSGPGSLFLHSDRPLISENRTSPILHELVHVAMGIHGDPTSDWIVEGLAEYYSIEVLRRSGGISERRFHEAAALQERRGARAPDLFVARASGAVTARAVTVLLAADAEIRAATGGKASLDEVARELAVQRGEVSLELLQSLAAKAAGRPLKSLERPQLQPGR